MHTKGNSPPRYSIHHGPAGIWYWSRGATLADAVADAEHLERLQGPGAYIVDEATGRALDLGSARKAANR